MTRKPIRHTTSLTLSGSIANLTVFLLVAVVCLAAWLSARSSSPLDRERTESGLDEAFWQWKARARWKANVLMLGDSRICRAVSPAHLTAQMGPGWRGLNWGFNDGGLNPEAFRLAERRLDRSGEPPVILLGLSPITLTAHNLRNPHYQSLMKRSSLLAWATIAFPRTMGRLARMEPPRIVRDAPGLQEYHRDGWLAVLREPGTFKERGLENFLRLFRMYPVKQELQSALMQQTREWTDQGIRVFAFRPPTTVEMKGLEDRISGFVESEFVEAFHQAGGTWIEVDNARYHSYDGSHIARAEAVKFSIDLGRRLAAQPSPPAPRR